MTYTNIKKRVASNIGYVDSSGDIVSSRDITETDIGNWVNDRYLDDLMATLATQYPEDYEQTAKANFYKTTSTIASISDTTLTISDTVFNTGMVGDQIYNSDDEDRQGIAAYTSTTVVTLDNAMSGWAAGETVYVLGSEFALGGDITDARHILYVGVKYDSEDNYYTTAHFRAQNDLFKAGSETYSAGYPVWYLTTTSVSDVPTTTIGILPEAEENVALGIKIRYLEMPSAMSADANVPRLPQGSHSLLVKGATADAFRKLLRQDVADRWEVLYQQGKSEMVANYALTRASTPPRVLPPWKLKRMLDRSQ